MREASFLPPVFHRHSRFLLFVGGLLVHIAFLISLKVGFLNPLFDDAMHRRGQAADFFAVVQAGKNFSDGVSIYSLTPQQQIVPYYYPYRYHPFVAYTLGQFFLLFQPFGAYGLWIILNEILLVINLLLAWNSSADKNRSFVVMTLWLLFSPYYLELFLGQFSFLMASLLYWALIAWERGAQRAGDISWIASLVVKSNSVLLVPVLMKQGKWKLIGAAGAITVALAVPYFASVPGTYTEFARNFTDRMSMSTILGNQGFAGLLGIGILRAAGMWTGDLEVIRVQMETMDRLMAWPLAVWTVAMVLGTLWVTIRASHDRSTDLFVLWILSFFLFYKHVWEHHYVLLLPAFAVVYDRMSRGVLSLSPRVFWLTFAVIALPTLFVFIDESPVLFDPELYWEPWKSFVFHLPKPLAVLILYLALASTLLKTKGSRSSPTP